MIGQLFGGVELTGQPQGPAVKHDQARGADQQAVGQVHFPAQQHAHVLLGQQLLLGQVLHQVGRNVQVPGAQRLFDSLVEQPLGVEPAASAQVQAGGRDHRIGGRPTAQQVGKQVVIAIPVAMFVQWHQKHLMGQQKAQDLGTVMGLAHRVTQLAAKAFLRSRVVEKRLHFGRQAIDDFFEQVVTNQALATVQRLRQRTAAPRFGGRQQPESQPRDPAFAARNQALQRFAA
ncbi:hypothetical protein D3C84_506800 [compost metagenome]